MSLSAEAARASLLNVDINDIDKYTGIDINRYPSDKLSYKRKLSYLAQHCCRGDYDRIFDFIQNVNDHEELVKLLNDNDNTDLYCGTVLHLVLYWNIGDEAIKLYNLLVKYGAEPSRDCYNQFPWDQKGTVWIPPSALNPIGWRDMDEFGATYESIPKPQYCM
jgi:hypothetical protein